ncbi:unnamed protein product, partial [Iphiclides podalirius]
MRNKAHTLPYFFSSLLNLDYPKDRLHIWIYSDYNEDNSVNVIKDWKQKYGSAYKAIYVITNVTSGRLHEDEKSSANWSLIHFKHVINLREKAITFARKIWADFIFIVKHHYKITLVLEDDIHFVPFFRQRFQILLKEIEVLDWDLVDTWKSYFPNRNLKAFSAAPLLVHPTHYTGQKGYISDTEDSKLVEEQEISGPAKDEL